MKHERIAHWVRRLEAGGIRGFELEEEGCVLRLRFGAAATVPATPHADVAPSTAHACVRAPSAGVFHAEHPLSGDAPRGERPVREGDIVGFLRVGEAISAVLAPCDGRLGAPRVADGALVGWGHALFDIDSAPRLP